jgi:hypothetical protein
LASASAGTCTCDFFPFKPDKYCCTSVGVVRKNPILDLSVCPNRVATTNPNYNNTPNGCGAKGGEKFPDGMGKKGTEFLEACNAHDVCWGTCNADKAACDTAFRTGLLAGCAEAWGDGSENLPTFEGCNRIAEAFYFAVGFTAEGRAAYDSAQKQACDCCPTEAPCPGGQTCCGDGACPGPAGCNSNNCPPGAVECAAGCHPSGTQCCLGLTPCASDRECCDTTCCPEGQVCSAIGCVPKSNCPSGAVDCASACHPSGTQCCGDLTPCPSTRACCGSTSCPEGQLCSQTGCIPASTCPPDFITCLAGCCQQNWSCCKTGSCCPPDSFCCDGPVWTTCCPIGLNCGVEPNGIPFCTHSGQLQAS